MKKTKKCTIIIVMLLLVGLIASVSYVMLNQEDEKSFYVGVTYCGSSVQEAKELVDKVKDYTNLFTLLSGPLRDDTEAMKEIGDYVCASNLNYAIFGSTKSSNGYWINDWTIEAKARWGEQFIGIYYMDEPGGNMLDGLGDTSTEITLKNVSKFITRTPNGEIMVNEHYSDDKKNTHSNGRTYFPDGRVTVHKYDEDTIFEQEFNSLSEKNQPLNGTIVGSYKRLYVDIEYYPNGIITIKETTNEGIIQRIQYSISSTSKDQWIQQVLLDQENSYDNFIGEEYDTNFYTTENITKYPYKLLAYDEVLKQHPIQTVDDAAEIFVNSNKNRLEQINKEQLQEKEILVFTSDYGLYWWDYKSGYDLILAELAWNNSVTQEIALVRGAANLQNKQWGTILTWKYTQAPYLADGEEMFEHMKISYETGAEYVMIFNYSEDTKNPNTLQEEHFQALERFWNEVVQNPEVTHGGIKAEVALVLPKNYGWGMRNTNDSIWGIWPADSTSQKVWSQLQDKIDQHGLQLDIVFEDSNQFVEGKYAHVYYWDQRMPVVSIVFAMLLMFSLITLTIIVYRIVNKKHKTTTK